MISLMLTPQIMMGSKKHGWNLANKVIATFWCAAADCIYLVPWVL